MDPAKDDKASQDSVHEALSGSHVRMCAGLNPSKLGKTGDIDSHTYERMTGKKKYSVNRKRTLNTKAFLGRTLRQHDGVMSVGHRVARAAGVIVDDNGKLRCPPGTPNANQFTDLNMTGCMDFTAAGNAAERALIAGTLQQRNIAKSSTAARMAQMEEKYGPLDSIKNQKAALEQNFPNAEIDLEERFLDRISPVGRRRVKAARRSFVAGLLFEAEEFPEVADNVTRISDALLPTEDNDNWAQTLWRVDDTAFDIEIGMSQFGAVNMSASEMKMSTQVEHASDLDAYWQHAAVHEFGHAVDLVNVLNQMGLQTDRYGKLRKSQPHAFDADFDEEFESLSKVIGSIGKRRIDAQSRRALNKEPKKGDDTVDKEYDIAVQALNSFLRDKINDGIHRQFDSFDDVSEYDEIVENSGSEYALKSFKQTKSIAEAKAEMFARARLIGHDKPTLDDIQSGVKKKQSKDYLRDLLGTPIKGAGDDSFTMHWDPTLYDVINEIEEIYDADPEDAAAIIDVLVERARKNVLNAFDLERGKLDRSLSNGEISQEQHQSRLGELYSQIPDKMFRDVAGQVSLQREYMGTKPRADKGPDKQRQRKFTSWRTDSRRKYERVKRVNRGSQSSVSRNDERLAIANPTRNETPAPVRPGRSAEEMSAATRAKNERVLSLLEESGGVFRLTPETELLRREMVDNLPSYRGYYRGETTEEHIAARLPVYRKEVAERLAQWRKNYRDEDSGEFYGYDPQTAPHIGDWGKNLERIQEYLDSTSDDELVAGIIDVVRRNIEDEDTRVAVQMPMGRWAAFMADGGVYRTTHEVQSDHSGADSRNPYEVSIGIPSDAPAEVRPASGYIQYGRRRRAGRAFVEAKNESENVDMDKDYLAITQGGAAMYGPISFVMRKEVNERTRFTQGDSFNVTGDPAPVTGATDEELLNMVFRSNGGKGGSRAKLEQIDELVNILAGGDENQLGGITPIERDKFDSAQLTSGTRRQIYHEAMIMGSFDLNDVESIQIDAGKARILIQDLLPESDDPVVTLQWLAKQDYDPRYGEIIQRIDSQGIIKQYQETNPRALEKLMRETNVTLSERRIMQELEQVAFLREIRKVNDEVMVDFFSYKGEDQKAAVAKIAAEKGLAPEDLFPTLLEERLKNLVDRLDSGEIPRYPEPEPVREYADSII